MRNKCKHKWDVKVKNKKGFIIAMKCSKCGLEAKVNSTKLITPEPLVQPLTQPLLQPLVITAEDRKYQEFKDNMNKAIMSGFENKLTNEIL